MKKKIALALAAIITLTGCAADNSVSSNTPQEQVAATNDTSTKESSHIESEESTSVDKPAASPIKRNLFILDGAYNTTVENNIDDDVRFEVYIEYEKEDGEVVSETITLDKNTSYNDIANKLSAFGLIKTDATREISYDEDYEYTDYLFEYSGIGHNISLAPDTEAALYLELVDDKGLVTDASLLGNGSYNPSVKAISSKLVTRSYSTNKKGNLFQEIPVTVVFKVYASEDMMLEYEDWQKERLNADGAFEIKVGMTVHEVYDMFDTVKMSSCKVMKNNDYTFIVCVDDTFDPYIGDVILIKNY